jgi:hypothetical protein
MHCFQVGSAMPVGFLREASSGDEISLGSIKTLLRGDSYKE